jgi:hypothetical protein
MEMGGGGVRTSAPLPYHEIKEGPQEHSTIGGTGDISLTNKAREFLQKTRVGGGHVHNIFPDQLTTC